MPANLTPEFIAARERFQSAAGIKEKLDCLEEMLAVIPKHKGTEHMQMDIKRRISKLKDQIEQDRRKSGKHSYEYHVPPEGAGQVIIIGPPNSGKSELLAVLTSASPEIAPYPFTTRKPQPGMMEFEDIQIQLVDTPPVTGDYLELWLTSILRAADAAILVADLSSDTLLDDIEAVISSFLKHKTRLVSSRSETDAGAPYGTAYVPTMILGNKLDLPGASDNFQVLAELYSGRFPVKAVSAAAGAGIEQVRRDVFDLLHIVRVYTKVPGKPADMTKPFALPRGSTLIDVARAVHRDFPEKLRFARAWGVGKPDGVMIARDHIIEDRDIIELHV